MTKNPNTTEYFEVFYHPNEFISQFRYAFDTLAKTIFLHVEYPAFMQVVQEKAKYPFVTVTHRKNQAVEFPRIYFSKEKAHA